MTQAREKATDTATPQETLDRTDRQLLDIIQTAFPLAPRPYAVLGEQLGISEEEAFTRVRALKARKIIRRLGANFQSARLGYVSTLCAAHGRLCGARQCRTRRHPQLPARTRL